MLVSTSTPSERSKLHMWNRLSRKSKQQAHGTLLHFTAFQVLRRTKLLQSKICTRCFAQACYHYRYAAKNVSFKQLRIQLRKKFSKKTVFSALCFSGVTSKSSPSFHACVTAYGQSGFIRGNGEAVRRGLLAFTSCCSSKGVFGSSAWASS